MLRRRHPPGLAAAAVETLELRERAKAKFSRADSMFFTREGLEQSSGETIARWRASRFPKDATVLDLCCGIGGDSTQLGFRGPVLSFDLNPDAVRCAAANAEVYGVAGSVSVACADVTRLNITGDAAFFDPSRRSGGRRVRRGEDYSPPLSFIHDIRRRIPDLGVKAAPSLADEEIESLDAEVTFMSDSGECKEAALWFGALANGGGRSAVILPIGVELHQDPSTPRPNMSEPRDWLFEPDPAVIRAHLIPEVAAKVNGSLLDSQIAYLTADSAESTPFGYWYRIMEWLPFNLNRIRERLRVLDAKLEAVKRRGVPMEPEEMTRRLKSNGIRPVVLVFTRVQNAMTAIICEPRMSANPLRATPKPRD